MHKAHKQRPYEEKKDGGRRPGHRQMRPVSPALQEQGGNKSEEMLTGIRDAVVIYNERAGRVGRRVRQLGEVQAILGEAGIKAELVATRGPGTATEIAREAVEAGRGMVVACGGDGTINEVVNGMAESRVPLAVLPAGTANVLAKELGLPWDIPAAARLIPTGRMERIALGRLTWGGEEEDARGQGRYFLSVAGAGPDGVMVHSLNEGMKARAGILAYWMEGFRQLVKYEFPRFRVRSAGREVEASLIVVGRTRNYGGPFLITTEADLFENVFEVMTCTSSSRWRYLVYLGALLTGQLRALRDVKFWKATEASCAALNGEEIFAQVDGEGAGRLPVEFRVVPDALTIVAPEGLAGQQRLVTVAEGAGA